MTHPQRTMSAGYGQIQDRERRRNGLAATHRANPVMERLIQLRESDREQFDRMMTPVLRIQLGSYEQAKAARQAQEKETTK